MRCKAKINFYELEYYLHSSLSTSCEIKNWKSKKAFSKWLGSRSYGIGHPFEIVFSWFAHGIHLYPPTKNRPFYNLRITNYNYVEMYIEMIKTLIKQKVSFVGSELNEVLKYLSGEKWIKVNDYDYNIPFPFFYLPSKEHKKKYFKHIVWERPNMVKFK